MGIFDKVRQMVGIDGVTLHLDVPILIKRESKVISGKVTISTERPQSFKWVKVELQKEVESRDGNHVTVGSGSTTSWETMSDFTLDQPFSLAAGEKRDVDFQMVIGNAGGLEKGLEQLDEMGGVAAGLGKVLSAMDLAPDYRIQAKVNVDGVALDPTKSVRVTID